MKFLKKLGVEDTEGIYVDSVVEESGAEKAGIKKGDIIKEIDHVKVSKFADLTGHIGAKRVGDIVNLKISRDGSLKTIHVTLTRNETLTLPLVGRVKNAKREDLTKFKASNGIKIIELDEKYADYWKKNGVKEGTIITSINDSKINSVDDAQEAIKNKSDYEPLRIELINANGERERYNFR